MINEESENTNVSSFGIMRYKRGLLSYGLNYSPRFVLILV